jgi:hypothetical protein
VTEEPDKPRRKRKLRAPDPREISLEAQRENREHLTFLRPTEEITLGPGTRFTVLPAEKGHGWVLRVLYDVPTS